MIWGYAWVPTKLGLRFVGPILFAVLRTLPGSILLLVLLLVLHKPLRPVASGLTLVIGLLQTAGFIGLTTAALVSGGAGRTAILANTWQFWIPVLAWPVLGERLRSIQWLSLFMALVGLVAIIQPWLLSSITSSLLALGGAFSYALASVFVKILRRHHNVDLLSLTAWQSFFGSLPLLVVAAIFDHRTPSFSVAFALSLGYVILMVTCLGSVLWLYALRELPAGLAGLGTVATPVVGILASWLQLGERPSVIEGIGMLLVVVAMLLLFLSQRKNLLVAAQPMRKWLRREQKWS